MVPSQIHGIIMIPNEGEEHATKTTKKKQEICLIKIPQYI